MLRLLWFVVSLTALRLSRWLGSVLVFLLLAWCVISLVAGGKFDEVCVEGRLSAAQAEAINSAGWEHCPEYRDGTCAAEANDRVFVGQCSEFFKFLWRPDKWGKAVRTGKLPWQY